MDSNNDGVVDQTEYEDNLNKVDNTLAPWLAKHVKVSNNSSQCNPNYGGFELKGSNEILFKVLYRCNEPADDLVVNLTVFRETDPKHQNYAKISFKDNTRDFVFREGKDQFPLFPKMTHLLSGMI